ncbi:MAG: hypothetical protein QOG64_1455 [Acidimicrobiaceae bacterium]|nr:hypothetical protein [Acidimicrobiaceae bacterium]
MSTSLGSRRTVVAAVLLAVTMTAAGCGASGSGSGSATASTSAKPAASGDRPATTARLQIVAPTPNQVTGADVTLQMNIIGGEVVPPTQVSGPLRGDQGHIHVSVDGQLVSMNYGTTAPLTNLKPGMHGVQAEYVAIDHEPFRNRVIAAVLFQVQ